MSGKGELAFIGDVHLHEDDADLHDFVKTLDRLGRRCDRMVFMGDLFNLWIGEKTLERPHQAEVVTCLSNQRERGVRVDYIEGNRDYGIADIYLGTAFDGVAGEGLELHWAGRRIFAAHGDLANVEDRQYRAWRRLSRSSTFRLLFRLIPGRSRLRLAERLELRMRSTNLGMKRKFPETWVRNYAAKYFDAGVDSVVLGHFHEERRLEGPPESRAIFVLPDWKSSHRYLRVTGSGEIGFASTDR